MTTYISTYLASLVTLIGLDAVFLGVLMRNIYASKFGDLMKDPIDFRYAFLFYVIYTAGVLLFVVFPAAEKQSLQTALYLGFAFGVVAYMTYDLTGAATIANFPESLVLIDIIWGGIATAIVSGVGYQLFVHLTRAI